MQYKLIGSNDTNNIIKTVLSNRGIVNCEKYLSLCSNTADDYTKLDNINEAVERFLAHFTAWNKIGILQDTDTDGVCSATIMYKYIKELDPSYPVEIIVHQNNKAHGLCGDFDLPDGIKLLIIPDAGSNDIDACQTLIDNNIDVIILDHHVKSDNSINPGVLVNNQMSANYINKNACGAHVTYNFLQALDDENWTSICDEKFADLVSVADIADDMSLKSFNTRAMVNYGLKNINNKMLKEIFKAQEFSTKGIVSPFTVAFYIAPLINAFIRSATFDERKLMVRAFCEDESETFEYTKRGEAFPIEENIYEHVVRLMKSYKGKQDRARDNALKLLLPMKDDYSNDKVVIVESPDKLPSAYNGLTAIRLSEAFGKPVLMVKKTHDGYAGSGRAFDNCPIEDFRALVDACPASNFGHGHPSAFGCSLKNIDDAINWFNNQLKDVNMESVYPIDFWGDACNLSAAWCNELYNNDTLFAKGVEKPLWLIKGLVISNETAKIVGAKRNVIQIYDEDTGIKYVKFKCEEDDDLLNWLNNNWDDNGICINVIGTLGINEYEGILSPQVIIEDYEIIEEN